MGMNSGMSDNFSEALSALTTLGYVKANAEKALMKVSKELGGTATIEELIKFIENIVTCKFTNYTNAYSPQRYATFRSLTE